ncbi:MAG TPA: hypothetical protein VKF79_11805 [Candidatus Acidoferrum sp.]|nr:hypothetical protein [Candidatus Acidoferrum sp.]
MSATFYVAVLLSVMLLAALLWALRQAAGGRPSAAILEDPQQSNVEYFSQIHQALGAQDREFLLTKGGARLARIVDHERRGVALDFLRALRQEFAHGMRQARVIASLSPEVDTMQEFERLWLTTVFHVRLQALRAQLLLGRRPVSEMIMVSNVVSRLNVRMETAMKELGERAALAAELASTAHRGDVDLV